MPNDPSAALSPAQLPATEPSAGETPAVSVVIGLPWLNANGLFMARISLRSRMVTNSIEDAAVLQTIMTESWRHVILLVIS